MSLQTRHNEEHSGFFLQTCNNYNGLQNNERGTQQIGNICIQILIQMINKLNQFPIYGHTASITGWSMAGQVLHNMP